MRHRSKTNMQHQAPNTEHHIQTPTQRSSVAPNVARARAAHRCFLRGGVLRPLLEGLSDRDGVSWRRSGFSSSPFAAGRLSGEPDRRRPRGDPLSLLLLDDDESESELSELELSDELLLL